MAGKQQKTEAPSYATTTVTTEQPPAIAQASRRYRLALTDRDRELLAALFLARHLSFEQLRALYFPGNFDKAARRRLRLLSEVGRGGGYVKAQRYVDAGGTAHLAFSLTEVGYELAAQRLQLPRPGLHAEVGEAFLAHNVGLADVLVALLQLRHGRTRSLPFRWLASDLVRLPFEQKAHPLVAAEQSLLVPDAVLEVPSKRRRLFLEYETGSHTLVARSANKRGATFSKALRYARYLFRIDDRGTTAYARRFPDGFAPELLFVTATATRANAIERAMGQAKRRRELAESFPVRALHTPVFIAELVASGDFAVDGPTRNDGTNAKDASVSQERLALMRRFYVESLTALKQARESVRARKWEGDPAPLPEYPPSSAALKRLLFPDGEP